MKTNELKPQVKVLLIILIVILFFILLENGINALGKYIEDKKYQTEYIERQEAYKETPQYKEEQYVAGCVKKTIELINAKKYEELYNRIDPTYKEIFSIDSVEKFKEISQNHIGENIDNVTLKDHYINNSRYICEVSIAREDSITTGKFVVTPIDEENFYVILDDVEWIEKAPQGYSVASPKVSYIYKYKVHKSNQMLLVIETTNRTNQDLKGSLATSMLQRTNRVQYELLNKEELSNITIPAGETINLIMAFSDTNSSSYHDDNLKLDFTTADGTIISNTMDLSFRYWE